MRLRIQQVVEELLLLLRKLNIWEYLLRLLLLHHLRLNIELRRRCVLVGKVVHDIEDVVGIYQMRVFHHAAHKLLESVLA